MENSRGPTDEDIAYPIARGTDSQTTLSQELRSYGQMKQQKYLSDDYQAFYVISKNETKLTLTRLEIPNALNMLKTRGHTDNERCSKENRTVGANKRELREVHEESELPSLTFMGTLNIEACSQRNVGGIRYPKDYTHRKQQKRLRRRKPPVKTARIDNTHHAKRDAQRHDRRIKTVAKLTLPTCCRSRKHTKKHKREGEEEYF